MTEPDSGWVPWAADLAMEMSMWHWGCSQVPHLWRKGRKQAWSDGEGEVPSGLDKGLS